MTQELNRRIQKNYHFLLDNLVKSRKIFWTGELSASALSTAVTVSAFSVYLIHSNELDPPLSDIRKQELLKMLTKSVAWIIAHQNKDGGWGDTTRSFSNSSTTMLVKSALTLFQKAIHQEKDLIAESLKQKMTAIFQNEKLMPDFSKIDAYLESQGGIEGIRQRYGKDKTFVVPILTNAAIAEIVSWNEVAPLPFELAAFPHSFFRFLQLPVVSYAIPALVAIGQVRFFHNPGKNPLLRFIRSKAIKPTLIKLQSMQPISGGFLEASPLTAFVMMSLISCGLINHSVVKNALNFLLDSIYEDGSFPIDTNLATWITTLSINAIRSPSSTFNRGSSDSLHYKAETTNLSSLETSDRVSLNHNEPPAKSNELSCCQFDSFTKKEWNNLSDSFENSTFSSNERTILTDSSLLNWLLNCQHQKRHPFTASAPGGWAWTDLSGGVPDADDTPGAILALSKLYPFADKEDKAKIIKAILNGVQWLLKIQNRDGGFPTFCRGWGTLPFDQSSVDLTAHSIRAFVTCFSLLQKEILWEKKSERINPDIKSCFINQQENELNRDDNQKSSLFETFEEKSFKKSCPNNDFSSNKLTDNVNFFEDSVKIRSLITNLNKSVVHGLNYIIRHQHSEGYWLPLWFGNQNETDDLNPYYGTGKVLNALATFQTFSYSQPVSESFVKENRRSNRRKNRTVVDQVFKRFDIHKSLESKLLQSAEKGILWGIQHQNSDGGWGKRSKSEFLQKSSTKTINQPQAEKDNIFPRSSLEETAVMLDGMIPFLTIYEKKRSDCSFSSVDYQTMLSACQKGLNSLCQMIETEEFKEPSPIGFYFAKLWYFEKAYPLVFACSALKTAWETLISSHSKDRK
ncbi:MAG: prenyltransferase/squalene oxidase repeat-containing protein [Planctomycetia bacterium]|nr:prenyltransferase/squalene oxidase repeat-containing protein [Planctomycetia bacterium]